MLKKTEKGFYVLEKLSRFSEVAHGFSTRELGNMKFGFGDDEAVVKNREKFFQIVGVDPGRIVEAEQVHGAKIAVVGRGDIGREIKGVDGLVTEEGGIYLVVKVADCVPILFYDPIHKVAGVAHGGWRGILGRIGSKLVQLLQIKFSCDPEDILIGLGPAIGGCCYNVSKERALKFQKFGKDIVIKRRGKWYLDLKKAIFRDLIQTGVLPDNIEVSPVCTFCQKKEFFSFRREGEKLGGDQIAVIGLRRE